MPPPPAKTGLPASRNRPDRVEDLLVLDRIRVGFGSGAEAVELVRGVSLTVRRGEIVGLVGESGCGKSLTALSILGLLPAGIEVLSGRLLLQGAGDLRLDPATWRRIRGSRIAMVFQEPSTALNPVLTIGFQIAEALRFHRGLSRRAAIDEARAWLERVAMPDPAGRLHCYPHQLSGGQQQRAVLALALAAEPELLLADEPTTALDVTVQAQILELLVRLREELGLTVMLITHDLGVVAGCCDRVMVMYAGEIVEEAAVGELFAEPAHPYTLALLAAVPRLGEEHPVRGIPGAVPEPGKLPAGCAFHPRCPEAFERCSRQRPPRCEITPTRSARCFLYRPTGDD